MVQDYFKYDKIQGGTPLSINANDGTKTEGKQGVTLGIKSTAQGLQHFTNWNDVSSSIDAKNTVRFEDGQPNQLYYKTNRSRFNALSSMNIPTDNTPAGKTARVMGKAEQFGNYYHEFTDEWYATDIKILDNIAVVAYPDYTDLHRTEQTFTGLQLRQPVRASWEGTYGGTPSYYDFFQGTGMVFAIDEGMPLMHKVGVRERNRNDNTDDDLLSTLTDLRTSSVAEAAEIYMSNQAYAFENTILKLWVPSMSPFGEGRYLYFVYGGAVTNTVGGEQDRMNQSLTANPDGSFTFDDFRFSGDRTQYIRSKVGNDTLGSSRNWTGFSDGDFAGYFYLITEASSSNARELPVEDNPSGKMHIQLSITHIWGFAQTDPYFTAKYQVSDDPILSQWHGYVDVGGPTAEATFIKYTPVRKCGKVDIYTKKSGIISAVLSHTITSPGHTLQTYDIIKITSALWDGTQTGAKDTHPLNGNKFVKVIDDDTFELYEDQFFEKPVSTTKLRTTTGIAWVCIGNANSNDAQSWSYNQTLFSPTGKNGYRATTTDKYKTTTRYDKAFLSGTTTRTFSKNAGLHVDFSCLPGDYVPLEEASDDRNWGIFYINGVSKKISGQYTAANLFGKRIREFIENTPLIDFGTSPLDTFSKGPQDFFPFTTAAINADSNPPYNGTRFGAAIDMKFSHNSGTSKVYTLVVGEPGSDTSVDMFGVSEEEYGPDGAYPHWVNTTQGALDGPHGIINTGRKRVFPYYLPHGKIHIFTVTVDQYGRISDITAQNSVFGDGSSVNNTCSNEEHPWETFMTTVRSSNYVGVNTTAGRRQMQGWSFKGDGTFDLSYVSETNGDRAAYIEDTSTIAPFNETLPANSSLYWDRAAIANWMGVNTYDYFVNTLNSQAPLIRRGPVSRNIGFTNTTNVAYSRFGSGVNQPVIDRFNWLWTPGTTLKNQFYILPWVDMFGKSVAVSNCNASGEILVFGSASVRSNIDYHSVSRTSSGTGVFRPVITVNSGLTSEFVDEYSVSQMGQISCIRVDRTSSYDTTQIVEINAGGSVDSSTTPVDSGEVLSRVTTGGIPFTIKELRTGEKLAGAYTSILRSFKTSGMSIVFDGEYLIWGEHDIGDSKSKLNLLRINYDNNSFEQFSGYTSTYVSSTKPNPNHEGLGEYISFSDGVLVTNALTRTNSFGVNMDSFVQSIQMYDSMLVFTIGRNGLMYHQSLSATFSGLDTRYTAQLLKSYEDNILDIGNINYDNHTFQSHTWNIRLAGQYSTIDKKILLKDPIEYVLFAPNYTYSSTNQSVAKTYSKQVRPYLEFTEIYKDDTVYYDYSLSSRRRIQDKSLWDTVNSASLQNTENITRTPVFFLNIPVDSIDQYGNLTITINKDSVGRILGSSINIDSFTVNSVTNNYDSLVPQIALYRKDPRAMIVPNGPSATGSDSTSAATYTNGIYDYTWSTFRTDDPARIQTPATPPLFRGGANDLFHYSSNPGTIPTLMVDEVNSTYDYTYAKQYFSGEFNLGELFDSTYNELGNVDKGLISWFANDIRSAARNANVDRGVNAVPYGQIFSEYAQVGTTTYTFTIPYSTWSPYIVRGSLLKDSSQNRPFFGSFTRIKHGTAGVDVVDPSSGTWDYTYNDTSRPTYIAGNIASDFHLMLGLVFTRHNRMTQSGAVFYNTSNPVYNLARFMGPSEQNVQRYSSNYSYNPIFGGVANAGSSTNFTDRAYVNNLHLETLIDGIGFDLDVTSNPKRRFIPKYHKIAYFEYNDSLYSETQRNDINATTNKVDRYAFGKYSFVPYPVGPIYNARTSPPQMTASSTNPIIRVGKSSSSTQLSQGNVGSFNDSIQVMATENVGNSRTYGYGVTVYYADDDTINFANTAGASLGSAYFDNRAMLGSFDIEQPEGLSLFISVVRSEKESIPLMVRNQYASGDPTLYVNAHGFHSGVTTLHILNGKSRLAKETELYIYGKNVATSGVSLVEVGADIKDANTSRTLYVDGVVGSGTKRGIELFMAAPLDYPGDTMPLWIGKDILSSGLVPLFTDGRYVTPGWTVSDKTATLHMSGAFNPNAIQSSGAPLYILGPDEWIVSMASGAPLYITTDIPETGVTGSWMYSSGATLVMVEDNNQSAIELAIEGAIASTGSIPLFIQRPFANAIPLVIKNQNPTGVMPVSISGAFIQYGDITLAIAPPEASGVTMYTRGYVE